MKLRDSNGGANHVVPLSNGVLRPPHVKNIGPALALFAKLEDMVSTGDGTDGIVLGGKPITDQEIAEALGLHQKTVSEHRLRLAAHGYITAKRTPHGHVIRVRKSKKWALIQQRRHGNGVKEPNGSITKKVMEPIRPVMEPNGSSDRAIWLHVDQTVAGHIQDVVGASAASECWKAIGLNLPVGTPDFQSCWQFFYSHKDGAPLSEAMERCIQNRQKKNLSVPKPFYDAKRAVEQREAAQPALEAQPIRMLTAEEIPA